ncbi:DUF4142 domain-containing protein [Actinoplanes sp. GCM10030250]|uniref:DUF4142 domain-containing protein n=1 Tax=Actinoplanes sp. GCM10030250 TaxID=3273376 RepID=UPI00361CA8E1
MSFRNVITTLGVLAAIAAPATVAHAHPETTRLAPAAVRPVGPDADFLIAAHQANLAQMKLGKLALRKGGSATIRDLGRQFAAYHRKLDAGVTKAATTLDVNLPKAPNSEQKMLLKQYRAADGAEFDTLFVGSQLIAHEHAIKLAKIVLATGTEPAVRHIVAAATPVIQKHHDALAAAQQRIGDAADQ